MRKLILIIHTSLDGFVADANGDLGAFPSGEETLPFVNALTRTADAALFGRKSYTLLNDYWPSAADRPGVTQSEVDYSNWYNSARKIVLSHTLTESKHAKTTIVKENVTEQIAAVKQQPGKDILIFGSPSVAQLLLKERLIDQYWVFVNPVIFGAGIPFSAQMPRHVHLKLNELKTFPNGEVGLHYILQ
jgi:dihydrofolate reductase